MKIRTFFFCLILSAVQFSVNAQGVAINSNGAGPDNSAGLDVNFPDKGMLIPRLTFLQRELILFPATGLMYYQTDIQPGLYYNSGTPASPEWTRFTTSVTGWQTSGNNGTIDGLHFLGTTDSVPLNFLVNNEPGGRISPDGNLFLGYKAGKTSTGFYNTAIGSFSLFNNLTGDSNVAIGYKAGYNETGSNKLYIENSGSSSPLIYGEFDNDKVRINGKLGIGVLPGSNYELDVNGVARAMLYYDYEDPNFYLDPASTSMLNDVRAYIFYDKNDDNYYANPAATSRFNILQAVGLYDNFNSYYFIAPANTTTSANLAGRVGIGTFPADYTKLDVNGAARAMLYYDYEDPNFYLDPASTSMLNDVRAYIFYDKNNDNYYANPAGTSRFNILTAVGLYDNYNSYYFIAPANTETSAMLAGKVCIGGITSASEMLEVHTSSTVGAYTTSGWTHSSDARLKKNIIPLENSLDKVLLLQSKRFDYLNDTINQHGHIGFLAQEVETLFPEFVVTGADGYKGITYGEMVPVLSKAIQEQQSVITELKQQNNELKSKLQKMEADFDMRIRALEETTRKRTALSCQN